MAELESARFPWYLHVILVRPRQVAANLERLRASGETGPALQAKLAELEQMRVSYQNPLFRFGMTFIEIFPVGLLIAIISAALLRNPKVLPARA